jgi:hypothetical protein
MIQLFEAVIESTCAEGVYFRPLKATTMKAAKSTAAVTANQIPLAADRFVPKMRSMMSTLLPMSITATRVINRFTAGEYLRIIMSFPASFIDALHKTVL